MSLTSDIEQALLRLQSEGKLVHWNGDDNDAPPEGLVRNISFKLSIQFNESSEEIPDEELGDFFTQEQIDFIRHFRRTAEADESELGDIFEYAQSLDAVDLNLSEFEVESVEINFSLQTPRDPWGIVSGQSQPSFDIRDKFDLYPLSYEEDVFMNPQYLLLTAIAINRSLTLELATEICSLFVKESDEGSPDSWVALGIITNPQLAPLHRKIIKTFVYDLTNYHPWLSSFIEDYALVKNKELDEINYFKEVYSYDIGRVVSGYDDLFHYEWDMMRDAPPEGAAYPEWIPLYHVVAYHDYGIALLDDGSERLVYCGDIESCYKNGFEVEEYPDVVNKIVKPILEKSDIQLSKYPAREIYDLFVGEGKRQRSREIWNWLCEELDESTLESFIPFGEQEFLRAVLENTSVSKELKAQAALLVE